MIKYLLGALLLICRGAAAQTYPFARLTGSPQMDTRGWRLTGEAGPGDTGEMPTDRATKWCSATRRPQRGGPASSTSR